MRHKWWLTAAAVTPLVASALVGFGQAAEASKATPVAAPRASTGPGIAGGITGLAAGNPFCKRLGKSIQASSAAQMFCFGAHLRPTGNARPPAAPEPAGPPGNVDAASPREDVSPALAHGYGQSETSIAAAGPYVVEAWNDSTAFFTRCGARNFKEEATGIGFSTDGGTTFTDLGGLPNPGCQRNVYGGDPSVAAYQVGGHTYFYISSLYNSVIGSGYSYIAFDPCRVVGAGSTAHLRCGHPIRAANSTQCVRFPQGSFCSFLDKEYFAIDPARGRLYLSYSEFPLIGRGNPIDLVACDIGTRSGGAGPAGGTPAKPVCEHGTKLVKQAKPAHFFVGQPYLTVAGPGRHGCENEGAYPAVNIATGAVYVGYEYNWASNIFSSQCVGFRTKTQEFITVTPRHCLTLAAVASCARPARHASVAVFSLDASFIPGYNRFPMNDFPRIAVSSQLGTVSMVWNDTRHSSNGDILLESFWLGSLKRVQHFPTVLDQPHGGGLTMMPALRVATSNGLLDVAWYSRASIGTPNTSVKAAIGVSPAATAAPGNLTITTQTSNWLVNSSDIIPNFGDYIDAVVSATGHWPYVGHTLYIAWSDGRSGVPQPFAAHLTAG